MANEQDCAALEQANMERIQQLEELEDTINDQQNFVNSLGANDPQRTDIQGRVDKLIQQKNQLDVAVKRGEDDLKACREANGH